MSQTLQDFEATPIQFAYGTFSPAQMRGAFQRVESPRHWKEPFEALIAVEDLPPVAAATEFFHGANLRVEVAPMGWLVQSPGYQG